MDGWVIGWMGDWVDSLAVHESAQGSFLSILSFQAVNAVWSVSISWCSRAEVRTII